MRKSQTDKKRFVPLILCSVLVLQQSLVNQAAASTVTDGNNVPINTHPTMIIYDENNGFFETLKIGEKNDDR